MQKITLTLKEGDPVEVINPRDLTVDFHTGTLRFTFDDEMGPRTGEYALDDLEDYDWETVSGTKEVERALTVYQHRAIRNLPPSLPGQPDLTYEPLIPRIAKPTEAKVPEGDRKDLPTNA